MPADFPVAARYSATVHSTYAELVDRLRDAEAEDLFADERSFIRRTRKGKRYWYSRRFISSAGSSDQREELYIGPDTPEVRNKIATLKEQAAHAKAAARARRTLVRQLIAAGLPSMDRRTGRIIEELARSGVFRLGGTLVGSHAFSTYSGLLGARLEERHARTQDVDLGIPLHIAVNEKADPDFKEAIDKAEKLLEIPSLDRKSASTRWRTLDHALKVELLTPSVGKPRSGSVFVSSLGVHAAPIRFLDYLLVETVRALILTGTGVLVRVPTPERYALHKLIIRQKRPRDADGRAKARKDQEQAAALIKVLLTDSPEDLAEAWTDLVSRGKKGWEQPARQTLRAMGQDLTEQFDQVITR